MYLQEVERQRPDVVVVPLGLASSSWLWELIYRRHPDLHPFLVRGPGGRDARVRRFLDAHPERHGFTTDRSLALRVGATGCVNGVVLDLAPCAGASRADGLLPLLRRSHTVLGDGSPGTTGLLAWEAETRARALAAEGRAREAFTLLTLTLGALDTRAFPERVAAFELAASDVSADGMGSIRGNLRIAASLARAAKQPGHANLLLTRSESAAR